MYNNTVRSLRKIIKAHKEIYGGSTEESSAIEKAADAIEELSKLADAIPHVCECCVGCELEKKNGGCDHAFVLSPKRAMQYLSKPRWIPVTERLPEDFQNVLIVFQNGDMAVGFKMTVKTEETISLLWRTMTEADFCTDCDTPPTHWMPLPEPPEEET